MANGTYGELESYTYGALESFAYNNIPRVNCSHDSLKSYTFTQLSTYTHDEMTICVIGINYKILTSLANAGATITKGIPTPILNALEQIGNYIKATWHF